MARRGSAPVDAPAMRRAGRVVAEMHETIRSVAAPGVSLLRLDRLARDVLSLRGAVGSFVGYQGYPAAICASVNDVVVHGVPTERVLAEGDLLSIDCGAIVDGWHGDAAFTMTVGAVGSAGARAEALVEVAERALVRAIAQAAPGHRVADVSRTVEKIVVSGGFAVVRDYTGHGIGRNMHEAPDVPNHATPGHSPKLRVGQAIAIEPIVVAGDPLVRTLDDGWTVVTCDGSLAAHVEHTVLITDHGPEVTTRL